MKKLHLILGLGAISMAMLFTACSEDETHLAPSFTIDQTSPIVLDVGVTQTTITGSISAEAGLEQVTVFKITELSETQIATITDFETGQITTADDLNYTINMTVTDLTENATIKFTALDKDDQESSQSIEIEVTEGVSLNEFTTVLMGAQSNADHGSTASLTTGTVYSISGGEASDNSASVDIVYYYGSRLAALYSPSQSDIQGVTLYNITSWGTINETSLGMSDLSASEFDEVTYVSDLDNAGTPSLDVIPELAIDNVVVFETASGKKGVFKVTDLNAGNDGTIEIQVKVEV
jgi:hypothetical protein